MRVTWDTVRNLGHGGVVEEHGEGAKVDLFQEVGGVDMET